MLEHDLTGKISGFLDRHMVIPLLDFCSSQEMEGLYDKKDLLKAKYDLISNTNMIDYLTEIHAELHGTDLPEELVNKRDMVQSALLGLSEDCEQLLTLIHNEELVAQLIEAGNFTMSYLESEYEISEESVDIMYEYGKFCFDLGSYEVTAKTMSVYRLLKNGTNPIREFFALWGKLASEILLRQWDAAMEDINLLKDIIDSPTRNIELNPLHQLQQRTWLIHWSLFVFFNTENKNYSIIDLLFNEKYLNSIQTNCPHILRYLTMAVITNKRRNRNTMRDLIKVIQQESYNYSDPITEFVQCLYVNFDFEGAQGMLQKCEDTLSRDFFLSHIKHEFLECARLTIFETYCRIHQVIDIDMLATKLNMERNEAEKWVVNLIRNARLDAKINSQENQVVMGVTVPSVYEQVIESTKSLSIRASLLAQNCERVAMGGGYTRGDDDRRGRRGRAKRVN